MISNQAPLDQNYILSYFGTNSSYEEFLCYKKRFDSHYKLRFKFHACITVFEEGSLLVTNPSGKFHEEFFAAVVSILTRSFEIMKGQVFANKFYKMAGLTLNKGEDYPPIGLFIMPTYAKYAAQVLERTFAKVDFKGAIKQNAEDDSSITEDSTATHVATRVGKKFHKKLADLSTKKIGRHFIRGKRDTQGKLNEDQALPVCKMNMNFLKDGMLILSEDKIENAEQALAVVNILVHHFELACEKNVFRKCMRVNDYLNTTQVNSMPRNHHLFRPSHSSLNNLSGRLTIMIKPKYADEAIKVLKQHYSTLQISDERESNEKCTYQPKKKRS